jgi:hypothetical protein
MRNRDESKYSVAIIIIRRVYFYVVNVLRCVLYNESVKPFRAPRERLAAVFTTKFPLVFGLAILPSFLQS